MIAFLLYLTFTVSYFLHMAARSPVLGVIHIDFILMGATLFAMIAEGRRGEMTWKDFRAARVLFLLILYVFLTVPLVQWPGSVIKYGIPDYAKVVFFFIFTLGIINTEKRVKIFVTVFLLCQIFRILEPLYMHVASGYWGDKAYSMVGGSLSKLNRLSGAPRDTVNANQFAWVIVTTLPFLYYLGLQRGRLLKLLVIGLSPFLLYALMLTGSRSGLLSLGAVIIAIILLGENRMKRLTIAAVLVLPLAFFAKSHLSHSLDTRYDSIINHNVAGGDTAEGRIRGLEQDLSTIWSRPIFGHGLGTSYETNANDLAGRAQITHDMYIEILQELGVVGFIIFIIYIKSIISSLKEAKKIANSLQDDKWLLNLITAIQVWIAMDLFYSISCFGLMSWEWYLFGGLSAACLRLASERESVCAEGECAENAYSQMAVSLVHE